ncbi:MAG: hypothetical protein ACJA0Q_000397 [Saprospiraceae bacterium]|jgi:hypothetical protein
MKHFITLTIFLFSTFQISAQLIHSIGLKAADDYSGLNYKVFLFERNALDLTLHSNLNLDFGLSALLEQNHGFGRALRGISWHYGGGFHVGRSKMAHGKKLNFGLDAVVGMEYFARALPISLSMDYMPGYVVNFKGKHLEYNNWAVAIRYVIN